MGRSTGSTKSGTKRKSSDQATLAAAAAAAEPEQPKQAKRARKAAKGATDEAVAPTAAAAGKEAPAAALPDKKSKKDQKKAATRSKAAAPVAAAKSKKPAASKKKSKPAPAEEEDEAAAAAKPTTKSSSSRKKQQKPKKKASKKQAEPEPEADVEDMQEDVLEEEEEGGADDSDADADDAGDAGEGDQGAHDLFMEEVHAKEQQLNKHCLIMGQVETEEDETTLEDLRGLTRVFVPEKVQEDFAEVWEQLDAVGEDSDDEEDEEGGEGEEDDDQDGQPDILGAIMKAILGGKMLSTKHSRQMHEIFNTHLDTIDTSIKSKEWQPAFCRWAALLMASHREKHWYEDTDAPKAAEGIYKRMSKQWAKLKARSDEELGGLVSEGDKSALQEFDAYLAAVAEDMRHMDYKV